MEDLIAQFDADLELRGMAAQTRKTYVFMVQQFAGSLQDKPLQDAGKHELKEWLRILRLERRLKTSSLQSHFSALSSFYDFLQSEDIIRENPVLAFRKRNLRSYKKVKEAEPRKLISVEEAARLVSGIVSSRDRAIIMLLLKTGMRRHELAELDIGDVDLQEMSMRLKETPKRTNRTVFFDGEALQALAWWLDSRSKMNCRDHALFVGSGGLRLAPISISRIVETHAIRAGLCVVGAASAEDRFTAHCCRHFFTTHLRRAGMPREFIQELRGDVRKEAIDIYDHIDKKELRESYLAHIPQLGI